MNPPVPAAQDEVIPDQDVDEVSFGVGFTALNTCKKPPNDPFPEIQNVKDWVSQYIKAANSRHNGRIGQLMQERLQPDGREAMSVYLQ